MISHKYILLLLSLSLLIKPSQKKASDLKQLPPELCSIIASHTIQRELIHIESATTKECRSLSAYIISVMLRYQTDIDKQKSLRDLLHMIDHLKPQHYESYKILFSRYFRIDNETLSYSLLEWWNRLRQETKQSMIDNETISLPPSVTSLDGLHRISELADLHFLTIKGTSITQLPVNCFKNTSIKQLGIICDCFWKIPTQTLKNSSLTWLSIRSDNLIRLLSADDFAKIPQECNIQHIIISQSSLTPDTLFEERKSMVSQLVGNKIIFSYKPHIFYC